ncbi:Rha family transcriptional regulator [Camelimonas lactis]|uniref:Rha family transcriptional regulator n=1 Tax=Camelimonas lactis TaxID=659006 RepID=UPI0010454C9C
MSASCANSLRLLRLQGAVHAVVILLSTSRRVCPHTQRGAVGAVSVLANSRHVAEVFGKRHDSVLRSIYDLDCSDDFRSHNFVETCEIKEIGTSRRSVRHFDMTSACRKVLRR